MWKKIGCVAALALLALVLAVSIFSGFSVPHGPRAWLAFTLAPGLLLTQTVAPIMPNWAIWLSVLGIQAAYWWALAAVFRSLRHLSRN